MPFAFAILGIAKAWRLALDPELKYAIENVDQLMKGLKRAGQMPPDGGEHALRTIAERLFQACQSKETEQITLDCLDPKTPAMMEKFKDRCEERFGSLQDAFESVDVEGVGIVSREDFRLLCHEVKATDGIFRLMEFLDPKRTGEIRLSLIDGEVTEDAMLATQTRRQMQKSQARNSACQMSFASGPFLPIQFPNNFSLVLCKYLSDSNSKRTVCSTQTFFDLQEHSAGVVAGLEQATQDRVLT